MKCSNCGEEISDGIKFCPNCGENLEKMRGTDSGENLENPKCPDCGHEISDAVTFCPNCGCNLKASGEGAKLMFRKPEIPKMRKWKLLF